MKVQAIASCRVSTPEQRENNSLTRQEESVKKAALELGAEIPSDGWWTGDISSKAGKNFARKDLQEMLDYCKKNKGVGYLIIDEPDRFMRSVDEAFYFEVRFREEVGVKIWYASDPLLNTDNMFAKLMRFSKYWAAEGGNEERQRKSVTGHAKAIREGRYTFPTKPGYKKGTAPGIHIPHPLTFVPLQTAFKEVASGLVTPLDALKKLNASDFTKDHAPWRMDKFRLFATDPYYAGVVEIKKQVNERNELGQHQAMLSPGEHAQLVNIFTAKTAPRGPKKQYNPDFPMNKILMCQDCESEAKFTGSKKNNGYSRKTTAYYYKYHCRNCGKSYHRETVHSGITQKLSDVQYTGAQQQDLIDALETVWRSNQAEKLKETALLKKRVEGLEKTKSELLLELPGADEDLKQDIKQQITKTREEIKQFEARILELSNIEQDLVEFVKFGLGYTELLAEDWWLLDHEQRVQCQLLIFPGGISFNAQQKVGTTQLSPIYGFKPNKKDLSFPEKSLLVEHLEKSSPLIFAELQRWKPLIWDDYLDFCYATERLSKLNTPTTLHP